MDCSPPGSSVQGILQAGILEWVTISSSRGSSWPRDRWVPKSGCVQNSPQMKSYKCVEGSYFINLLPKRPNLCAIGKNDHPTVTFLEIFFFLFFTKSIVWILSLLNARRSEASDLMELSSVTCRLNKFDGRSDSGSLKWPKFATSKWRSQMKCCFC